MGRQPGAGAVGGESGSGIAGGRDGHLANPQLDRPRNGGGNPPRLEGASRVKPFVLDEWAFAAEWRPEPWRGQQRSIALSQRDDVLLFADREQLAPSPHPARTLGEAFLRQRLFGEREIVSREEHFVAAAAERLQRIRVPALLARAALEVGKGARLGNGSHPGAVTKWLSLEKQLGAWRARRNSGCWGAASPQEGDA